uniref:Uncharacterized protein n=1 Tax=Lactuca sativa TaxID=4236 RepID=A0A9R1ULI9_LACSA|nr:hypothetical protein LSAT_V11C800411860 [Lactuca sativa]
MFARYKTYYSICCYNGKAAALQKKTKLYTKYSSIQYDVCIYIYDWYFDHAINFGGGPYVYRIHGQNYHIEGNLLPEEGKLPKFCQLYIYDTDHEVGNGFNAYEYVNTFYHISKRSTSPNSMANPFSLKFLTVHELMGLLDSINSLVKQFRMTHDRFGSNPT